MTEQTDVDAVADRLVERGVPVTTEAVRAGLREDGGAKGRAGSNRDLHALLADWKRRRRHKPHLALLDLPDEMERALAAFAERVMAASRGDVLSVGPKPDDAIAPPGGADMIGRMLERMEDIARDTRALNERVEALAGSQAGVKQPPKPRREGRRRGLSAVMGRIFWDRMMQGFVEEIRRHGPMSAAQLHATLDVDALQMAEAAFERIDASLIVEKVEERARRKHYFRKNREGLYEAL